MTCLFRKLPTHWPHRKLRIPIVTMELAHFRALKHRTGNGICGAIVIEIVHIDWAALSAIHSLIEEADVPVGEARFLQPYSAKTLDVFRTMSNIPSLARSVAPVRIWQTVAGTGSEIDVPGWQMSSIWHETGAQKNLGAICRETQFREDQTELVISGPMFHVGNPFYKTPKSVCRTNADYQLIDLTVVPENYLPRSNYGPAVEIDEYLRQLPRCRWDSTRSSRRFLSISRCEGRSLISAVVPPGIAHVHTVESIAFNRIEDLISISAVSQSIVLDFLTKTGGRSDIFNSTVSSWPVADPGDTAKHRALRLSCLTSAFAETLE